MVPLELRPLRGSWTTMDNSSSVCRPRTVTGLLRTFTRQVVRGAPPRSHCWLPDRGTWLLTALGTTGTAIGSSGLITAEGARASTQSNKGIRLETRDQGGLTRILGERPRGPASPSGLSIIPLIRPTPWTLGVAAPGSTADRSGTSVSQPWTLTRTTHSPSSYSHPPAG